jgi:hypothetical protein
MKRRIFELTLLLGLTVFAGPAYPHFGWIEPVGLQTAAPGSTVSIVL